MSQLAFFNVFSVLGAGASVWESPAAAADAIERADFLSTDMALLSNGENSNLSQLHRDYQQALAGNRFLEAKGAQREIARAVRMDGTALKARAEKFRESALAILGFSLADAGWAHQIQNVPTEKRMDLYFLGLNAAEVVQKVKSAVRDLADGSEIHLRLASRGIANHVEVLLKKMGCQDIRWSAAHASTLPQTRQIEDFVEYEREHYSNQDPFVHRLTARLPLDPKIEVWRTARRAGIEDAAGLALLLEYAEPIQRLILTTDPQEFSKISETITQAVYDRIIAERRQKETAVLEAAMKGWFPLVNDLDRTKGGRIEGWIKNRAPLIRMHHMEMSPLEWDVKSQRRYFEKHGRFDFGRLRPELVEHMTAEEQVAVGKQAIEEIETLIYHPSAQGSLSPEGIVALLDTAEWKPEIASLISHLRSAAAQPIGVLPSKKRKIVPTPWVEKEAEGIRYRARHTRYELGMRLITLLKSNFPQVRPTDTGYQFDGARGAQRKDPFQSFGLILPLWPPDPQKDITLQTYLEVLGWSLRVETDEKTVRVWLDFNDERKAG